MKFASIFPRRLILQLAGCAPDSNFSAGSGQQGQEVKSPPLDPVNPETLPPELTDLTDDDQLTLDACQKKNKRILIDAKNVESVDVVSSISNSDSFFDTYEGTEKRVPVVNITAGIANKLSLRLTSQNTTYCVNINSQIINRLDVWLASDARRIETRRVGIINKVVRHPL